MTKNYREPAGCDDNRIPPDSRHPQYTIPEALSANGVLEREDTSLATLWDLFGLVSAL